MEDLTMPKGLALAIGLNEVNPQHYNGWSGVLNACEADAEDMSHIAKTKKFAVSTLMTKQATRRNVVDNIKKAAKVLQAGDIYMLSYSGHGGQLPDLNDDEPDQEDETWCLYDGQVVDDELYELYSLFKQGVRILVFSDSCHSGTVAKQAFFKDTIDLRSSNLDSRGVKYRNMPGDITRSVYRKNKEFYDKILRRPELRQAEDKIKASLILISGCQDNQLSADGDFNGLFTSNLLRVWKEGAFQGSYKKFHRSILKRMPPNQSPNYFAVGKRDTKFETQLPFTVG